MAFIDTNRARALSAALGENHAKATNGTTGFFATLRSVFESAHRRRKLRQMPSHLLRDIGLTDGDISVLHAETEIGRPENFETLRHMR